MSRSVSVSVKYFRDGREVCLKNRAGEMEYKRRREAAYFEHGKRCWLCGKFLTIEQATSDHVIPRGVGGCHRDDRASNIRPCCGDCNIRRGSRRMSGIACPKCKWLNTVGPKETHECFHCNLRWP